MLVMLTLTLNLVSFLENGFNTFYYPSHIGLRCAWSSYLMVNGCKFSLFSQSQDNECMFTCLCHISSHVMINSYICVSFCFRYTHQFIITQIQLTVPHVEMSTNLLIFIVFFFFYTAQKRPLVSCLLQVDALD